MADTPSNEQARAMAAIDAWFCDPNPGRQVFYLGGPAGVGKSKTAGFAIAELRARSRLRKVCSGALAGKAAHNMRLKGVEDASTIHSLIYEPREDDDGKLVFSLRVDGPVVDSDLLVFDECSMIDEKMGRDILSFRKKVLVLGDPYQLPPVSGAGFFTSREPDFLLTEIHRQAAESPIIRLATLIRDRQLPRRFGSVGGAHVLPLTAMTQRLVARQATMPICGVHRVRWAYTARLRELMGYDTTGPAKGEKIIIRRNDRELGIFNGMMGVCTSTPRPIIQDGMELLKFSVQIEGEDVVRKGLEFHPWRFQQLQQPELQQPKLHKGIQEADFGHVLTVHSAQGSEWPSVTVIDDSRVFRDDRWRWLYTAVTRASDELVLLLRDVDLGNWHLPEFADFDLNDMRKAA